MSHPFYRTELTRDKIVVLAQVVPGKQVLQILYAMEATDILPLKRNHVIYVMPWWALPVEL